MIAATSHHRSARRLVLFALVALATWPVIARQQPTFRASVRLVETNVLVHDRNGQPVTGLSAADFRIFEDGKEQKIEVFSVQINRTAPAPASGAPVVAAPAASVFTNRVAQVIEGGVTVILFDRLNSSFEDQKSARDQIVKFVATLQPGDRVALYVLESDAVTVLHDFTSDVGRLIASANRYLGKTSTELSRSEEKADPFERIGVAALDADTDEWLNTTAQMVSESFLRRRVALTTNALEQIGNHLAGIPGRKNLVWVSAAFPFEIPTSHGAPQNMTKQISRATRAINNADVAVYPIDIRGLIGAFANPAAATATTVAGARPSPVFTTMANTHPNQDSMRTIAEDTGGRVFFNSNAIGQSVRRAIDDSRVSYVLGYYSPRAEGDGTFRKIDVKVGRGGVDVRHRKGYLALPPEAPGNPKSRLSALERVLQSPIEAAGIGLTAEIVKSGGDQSIVVRVDPAALTWTEKKDVREAAMDVVITQSAPDGRHFTIKETTVNLTADAERYQAMVEAGLTLSNQFTPRAGAYRLHVVISDVASQSVGSLIIPIK